MVRKERWIVFFDADGRELCAITVRGMMPDEIRETISLLAYERGINAGEIGFAEVSRAQKIVKGCADNG